LKILFYGGSSGLLFPREGDFLNKKSFALPTAATPNRPRVRETRYKGRGPEASDRCWLKQNPGYSLIQL
jgi:hypothetical protein